MNKIILTTIILALFGTHAIEARHNKTQIVVAVPEKVVAATSTQVIEDAQSAAAIQTLQEVIKNPEDVCQLVTQLEQHKEVQSWLSRNKKFLISAGISAGVVATLVLWWWFKKQNPSGAPVAPA